MSAFLDETLPRLITDLPPYIAYVLAFLGGVLTSGLPCNLSMVPVIIGYVGGQQDLPRRRAFWLSLFFTIGSSLTCMLLGVIAATMGALFGTGSKLLHWLVALVCLVIGLHLLGAYHISFDFLARLQPKRISVTGIIGAFLLGLIVGLAGSQCGAPVFLAIMAVAAKAGKLAYGATLLLAYGLGRGVPIVLAGTFTGVVKALPALERWTNWMEKAAGVVLVVIGLYFIWRA